MVRESEREREREREREADASGLGPKADGLTALTAAA